jgi:hypothetical protein
MRAALLALCLLACSSASGQVVELTGGDSTLYSAAGAGATFYLPNSTTTFGAGFASGKFVMGASYLFEARGNRITLGDSADSFSAGAFGVSIPVRGVTIVRNRPRYSLTFFAGATGDSFSAPFFSAATARHLGSGVLFARELPRGLKFSSLDTIEGNKRTAVAALDYKGWGGKLTAGASGGLLESAAVWNASASVAPDKHFSFSASRSAYLYAGLRSTVDSAGASASVGPLQVHASAFAGQSGAIATSGQTAGAAARFGPVDVRADYFLSRFGNSLAASVGEQITRRFSVREFLNESAGRYSANFGGTFTSNVASVDVGYNSYFFPGIGNRSPFQSALSVTVSVQLPHSSRATLQTYVAPGGATRWGVYGGSFVQGPYAGGSGAPTRATRGKPGRYAIAGRCVDSSGSPVEGCAVQIGRELAYSGPDGSFSLSERKAGPQPVAVSLADFTAPGNWCVVSAPAGARPGDAIEIEVSRAK